MYFSEMSRKRDVLMRRVFRAILLVTIFDVVGWAITQSIVAVVQITDLSGKFKTTYCFLSGNE